MHQQQTAFENKVEKEEIARNKQSLLFLQCFLLNQIIVPHLSIFLTSYFYLLLQWKSPKLEYDMMSKIWTIFLLPQCFQKLSVVDASK